MKNLKVFGLSMVAAMSITACSSPSSSAEYKSLKSEVDGIQVEVNGIQVEVNGIQVEVDSLQTKVDSADSLAKKLENLKKERVVLMNNFATLLSVPSRKSAAISKFALPACKTFTDTTFDLWAKYDDIDSTAYKNELKGIIGARDYVWSSLRSTFESYPDGVNKYITELDFDECYTTNWRNWMKRECKTFDRLMLKKDTNSYIGRCLKGTVKISQSDAATGPCAFQGYISGDYDVRAQFGITLDAAKHAADTACTDAAKKLTEGKTVQFWGFVIGSYTYTTTSNGSQTVPAFKVMGAG